jgi:hypothetical protein
LNKILSCILSSNWGTVWYISEQQEKKCLVQFGRRKCSEPHANCAQFGASQS